MSFSDTVSNHINVVPEAWQLALEYSVFILINHILIIVFIISTNQVRVMCRSPLGRVLMFKALMHTAFIVLVMSVDPRSVTRSALYKEKWTPNLS